MTPETIRFSKWQRVNLAAAVLVFAGLFVFTIGFMSDFSFLSIFFSIMVLTVGIGTVAMGIRAVNAFLFRIEFLESSFRVHSFSWKGKKVAQYAYADVTGVKRGAVRGEVIVELGDSMPLRLTPFLYEGKEKKLIAEFEKHLPAGKVEPDLGIALTRFKKYDKITYPLYIGFMTGLLLLVGLMGGMDLVRPYFGWPNAVPWKLGTFYDALSVDARGAVWFAASDVDTDAVQVGRISGGKVERWDVPAEAIPELGKRLGIDGVGGNSDNYPVLFFRESMISWTGAEWKLIPLPGILYEYSGFSVSNDALRFLNFQDGKDHYWSCPFDGSACEELPVPGVLADPDISRIDYREFPTGPVLVAGTSKGPITFYRYEDGAWSDITGALDLWEPFLLAWTVSGDGTVWVAKELTAGVSGPQYSPGPLEFGRWDSAAGAWRWSRTDAFPGSFRQEIENMEVDPLGRIWIAGHYETADIRIGETAAAYSVRDGRAELVMRYTDKNSNFQTGIGGCGLVQGLDGTLWSCNSSLISLNAGAEKLPTPIPAWIADLDNLKFQWIVIGIVIVLEVAYFIVLGVLNWKQRKSAAPGIKT